MRYTLEISEKQAKIIKIALEEYFRLRMNQTWDFADSLCFEEFDYENHSKEDFNERIEQRDVLRDELKKLLNKHHPLQLRGGKFREQTLEMRRSQDIWQVIRHKLYLDRGGDPNGWSVDAREPIKLSDETLPKMEVFDSDKP